MNLAETGNTTGKNSRASRTAQSSADQKKPSKLVFLLMLGHICVDMVQGGIAAVIPFLVVQNSFSFAAAGMLVFAANIASAIIQPLFGWLGDRAARPWLMAFGVALAGIGMAGIGLISSYWLVVMAALVSGIGNAMLHPEGGRLAYLVGGDRKAESMSAFSVGGQIGFCVGPVMTIAFVSIFGLPGMALYLAICIPVAAILLAFNGKLSSYGLREDEAEASDAEARDRWGAFSLVLGACSVRSVVFYGITSFVPLLIVANFGESENFASSMITVFAAVGAVATLASGFAARRIKTSLLMLLCFALLAICIAGIVLSHSLAAVIAFLMLGAVGTNLFNPPAVTLGQSYLPNHLGMASGLSFGVAVAFGGVMSPILGSVGDITGLDPVMWIVAAFAVAGFAVSVALKRVDPKS